MPLNIIDQPAIARMNPNTDRRSSAFAQQILRNGYQPISEFEIRNGIDLTETTGTNSKSRKVNENDGGNLYIRDGDTIPGTNYVLGVMAISLYDSFVEYTQQIDNLLPVCSLEKERYDLCREAIITFFRAKGIVLLNEHRDAFLIQSDIKGNKEAASSFVGVEPWQWFDASFQSSNIFNQNLFLPIYKCDYSLVWR